MNIYIYIFIYIYVYHFFVTYHVFRQCQWDTSCRSRPQHSNAKVKNHFRLTDVEIWPISVPERGHIWGTCEGRMGEPGKPSRGNQGWPRHGACTLTRTVRTLKDSN